MKKNKKMEIAVKIENESQLDDIDITRTHYNFQNDFTAYFKNIYFSAVSEYLQNSIERIYFGAEFCELRIPDYKKTKRICEKAEKKGYGITFLSPPVTEYGLERIKNLLPLLQMYDCEISVNDYGVLELIHSLSYSGKIISGRILDKMYHDGRMNSVMYKQYCNEKGYKYLRSPAVSAFYYQDLLKKYSIDRYDIDIPLYGVDLSSSAKNINFSAFLPYGYVTTGRICMMRNYKRSHFSGFDLTDHNCTQSCRMYDQLMIQPVSRIQNDENNLRKRSIYMMRKGNTIFYQTNILPDEAKQFNRIIIQQSLML